MVMVMVMVMVAVVVVVVVGKMLERYSVHLLWSSPLEMSTYPFLFFVSFLPRG